jgi:hypothetical protein
LRKEEIMDEKFNSHGELEKSDSKNPSLPVEHSIDAEALVIDHHAEAKLVRKLDIFIIPITMLLYLFSFLDRQVMCILLYGHC